MLLPGNSCDGTAGFQRQAGIRRMFINVGVARKLWAANTKTEDGGGENKYTQRRSK